MRIVRIDRYDIVYNSYLIFIGLYFKTFNKEYVITKLEIINSHLQINDLYILEYNIVYVTFH